MRVHDSNNDKAYFRKQRRRYDQRGTITAYSDCLNLPPIPEAQGGENLNSDLVGYVLVLPCSNDMISFISKLRIPPLTSIDELHPPEQLRQQLIGNGRVLASMQEKKTSRCKWTEHYQPWENESQHGIRHAHPCATLQSERATQRRGRNWFQSMETGYTSG
ncbi:hypothetical protein Mal48_05710 [Thalassoglobus polymorphus]|uniref:Uncharacterized protein n=1 Tax=Thalassoglobus polymorphus TaxID=2527994 RepID=A0A517QI67_9PLAN|nr:hypothetical protein Mal48_05710 [Thalassoglobus polymorphus]